LNYFSPLWQPPPGNEPADELLPHHRAGHDGTMAGSTNPIPRNPAGPPVFFRRRHPGQNRQIKFPGGAVDYFAARFLAPGKNT